MVCSNIFMGNDGMNDIVRWFEWKMKFFNDPYAKRGCYECAMFEQIVYPHVIKLWAIYLLYSIQIQVSIYWQSIIKTIALSLEHVVWKNPWNEPSYIIMGYKLGEQRNRFLIIWALEYP